jgi:drug/metabolite transporter (DMT)-like permease
MRAYLGLLALVIIGVFLLPMPVKAAVQEQSSYTMIAVQLLIGALVLLLIHSLSRGNFIFTRGDWARVIVMSLLGVTAYRVISRYTLALALSDSLSNIGLLVLLALTPMLVGVLHTLKRRSVAGWEWAATVFLFIGVLASIGSLNMGLSQGVILSGLTAALTLAGYTVLAESLLERHTALKVAAISTALGSLLFVTLFASSFSQQDWGNVTRASWVSLLTTGAFTVGFGYLIWSYAIQHLGGLRTTLFASLLVVFPGYAAYFNFAPAGMTVGVTLLVIAAVAASSGLIKTKFFRLERDHRSHEE